MMLSDRELRRALRRYADAVPVGVDATDELDAVRRRGTRRRRRQRSIAGGIVMLSMVVFVAGLATATGSRTKLDVGDGPRQEGTTMPPSASAERQRKMHLDLFSGQLDLAGWAVKDNCGGAAVPVISLLPTVDAPNREAITEQSLSRMGTIEWVPTGPGTVRNWLVNGSSDPGRPVVIIEPLTTDELPTRTEPYEPPDRSDPLGSASKVGSGSLWLRCIPGAPLLRMDFDVKMSNTSFMITWQSTSPTQVRVDEVPDLELFGDQVGPPGPGPVPQRPDPSSSYSGKAIDLVGHAAELGARAWCYLGGSRREARAVEIALPEGSVDSGSHSVSDLPGMIVPWDKRVGRFPRIQVVSARWEPDATPMGGVRGVQRATFEIYCDGRSAPLHIIMVRLADVGVWKVAAVGSATVPELPDVETVDQLARPDSPAPAWRAGG